LIDASDEASKSVSKKIDIVLDERHFRMSLCLESRRLLCFLRSGLGAFGRHWLKPTLETRHLVDVWNKAVL